MMAWLGFILSSLWFDAALLLIGVTAVYLSMQRHRVPAMIPLKDRSCGDGQPEPSNSAEAQLQDMGFRYCGDYDFAAMRSVGMFIQAYLSPDELHWAAIVNTRTRTESFSMVEFSTRLSPFGSITTNNGRNVTFFRYPVHKILLRAPWKRSVRELYDLHLSLLDVAQGFGYQAQRLKPADFRNAVIASCKRDYEMQIAKGILTPMEPDTYRLTLKGAAIGTPIVWFQMMYGFLFFWYRRSDASFCRKVQKRCEWMHATGYQPSAM